MTTRRIVIAVGLLSLALAAGFDLGRLRGAAPARNMIDLSIFYCAGRAVLHRQNPYALESIRACEHRLNHGPAWNDPAYVMPAPLPPFAFPPYAALSTLDYGAAKGVAGIAIAAAVVLAALALADIGVPFAAALAALALADGFVGLFLGQVYPFTIALLALAAASLRRKRDGLAGFFAALSLIQPQIGVPICLSLLIWAARARIALVAWAIAMAVIGVSIVGTGAFVQWATQVIPGEARAEVFFWGQYSLTSVLASLGVGTGAALLAGSASFVAMLAVATWLAKRLAERLQAREYLVLVPPALCVIGGTFAHLASVAAAIPLALALAIVPSLSGSRWRVLAPLILLAIPWPFAQAVKALFFSCVLVAAVILVSLRANARAGTALLLAAAAGVYLIALVTPPPAPIAIAAGGVDPWRELAKLPSWIGLIWLLAIAIKTAARNVASA